jgi:hypothetical protein
MLPRQDGDVTLGHAEALREESHERRVGLALDRRGRQAHLERIAMQPIDARMPRAGLDMELQVERATGGAVEPGAAQREAEEVLEDCATETVSFGVRPISAQFRVAMASWMMLR